MKHISKLGNLHLYTLIQKRCEGYYFTSLFLGPFYWGRLLVRLRRFFQTILTLEVQPADAAPLQVQAVTSFRFKWAAILLIGIAVPFFHSIHEAFPVKSYWIPENSILAPWQTIHWVLQQFMKEIAPMLAISGVILYIDYLQRILKDSGKEYWDLTPLLIGYLFYQFGIILQMLKYPYGGQEQWILEAFAYGIGGMCIENIRKRYGTKDWMRFSQSL